MKAIALFVAAMLVVFVGFPVLMMAAFVLRSADSAAVLAKAQPVGDRIVAALAEYRAKQGRYPADLADLVKDGLMEQFPQLPRQWKAGDPIGPKYQASAALDFYQLYFGYFVPEGLLGDDYYRVLVSDDPKGWQTTKSPKGMEDLVADRLLARYRQTGDGKTLGALMSEVMGKVECDYLYRSRVEKWLGAGGEVDLPPGLAPSGRKGFAYQAKDEPRRRYCFVYKDHWLPGLNDSVDNYPVVDKLFLVDEAGSSPTWKVLRECPKSRHDAPPRNRGSRVGSAHNE